MQTLPIPKGFLVDSHQVTSAWPCRVSKCLLVIACLTLCRLSIALLATKLSFHLSSVVTAASLDRVSPMQKEEEAGGEVFPAADKLHESGGGGRSMKEEPHGDKLLEGGRVVTQFHKFSYGKSSESIMWHAF